MLNPFQEESMMFKKSIQTLLLGFALCCFLWVGIGQNPTIAATLTEAGAISQERMQTLPNEPLNLQLEVDRYLTSMPSGYYTISNVAGLKSQLENPQTVLVDVREPSEYQLGHIANAINIPLRSLAHNLDQVPHDRPVVLYCSSGYRSAMGVMTLHLLGYENVRGFPPSFAGWQAAGEAISPLSTH
jgi:rhodanese-related sulfurtransferase